MLFSSAKRSNICKRLGFLSFPKHFGESKGAIQETAEATNKIANKIRKDSKTSPQKNLETNELQMSMVNTNLKKDVYIYIYIYIYIFRTKTEHY